jgi:hypothetical protein
MPKRVERKSCVPEAVLLTDGRVETVMLDERYAPYEEQSARLENLCGSFLEHVSPEELKGVVFQTYSEFGRRKEVFSVHGNVVIHQNKAAYMGVRGAASLERLAEGLRLASPRSVAHMALFCGKLGRRVQVSSSGLLETLISGRFARNLRIEGRMYDHTNTVRVRVHTYAEDGVFALDKAFRPTHNDWTITGRGTVMVRFTWKAVEWTRECEAACLALCDRVITQCLNSH